jgi:hypothetical protein
MSPDRADEMVAAVGVTVGAFVAPAAARLAVAMVSATAASSDPRTLSAWGR